MQTLIAYVENKPGVLNRVSSLARRLAINIDSLTVGPTENESRFFLAELGFVRCAAIEERFLTALRSVRNDGHRRPKPFLRTATYSDETADSSLVEPGTPGG